ncbi:hypothetical protein PPTG_08862 [Phytophthora nicotianae INRA-310]|uniref:MULE transposase domain-containing protein n=1 Tax=Phytophthora nicotianae (strain INRA-310) TaxID=761204 RepID=W2QJW6_PHYN3|nr:hypothetical protein PPTG_08862 [Phytophthora nicotianae INRA-310]ETN12824.1 hypothetical protein PPTG_08862 [Phytophthora nicotianae INRA-310]
MPRPLAWNTLTPSMPRSDADMLLDTLKAFSIAWSDVGQCNVCADAAPHAMRTQLLRCRCDACSAAAPATLCPWRGCVRACQEHDVVAIDELYLHVTHVRSLTRPRLTPSMKELARDWAAQGLRPARIWRALIQRFGLDEETVPPLSAVQRFVYHHVTTTLGGSDRMGAIRLKLRKTGFTNREEDNAAFTFTWRTDRDDRPMVGNGSDARPFVVGVTTKKLLRQADRDPDSFILHVDATYKLTQTGYPVIVIGISDRARKFHLLAIFIASQQQQPQYAEILSMLSKVFCEVTGRPLRVHFAMGDADSAQWNALYESFGGDGSPYKFLMCYFHVAKKIYEKTRSFDTNVAAMVMRDLHELHFSRSDSEFQERKAEVLGKWEGYTQLRKFVSYFRSVWLNARVWRWQCYHTVSGFATTNNPCEAYNATIKRDVTLRRKQKVGALIDQLLILCRGESVRARAFTQSPGVDDRMVRRARALARAGLLREFTPERTSIAFLLGSDSNAANHIVSVVASPASRVFNLHERRSREDLPISAQLGAETARMELMGMPATGWDVNINLRCCPCRLWFKMACCVHLLYALGTVGGVDGAGRDTLVYRGSNKRKRGGVPGQAAGRPKVNGPALSVE